MMKYFMLLKTIYCGALVCAALVASGQSPTPDQHLAVSFNKTSSIVFPAIIKSVDRGSRDILAQKAKQIENVLQVKAASKNFQETNLTVITSDGRLHNFIVTYAEKPEQLDWFIPGSNLNNEIVFTQPTNEKQLEAQSLSILQDRRWMHFKNVSKYGIGLTLDGIYVNGQIMFYRLTLENKTNIDYDIESLRFYVIDKVKARRTASQELTITPMFQLGDATGIRGNTESSYVYSLQKFTIPDAKRLVIELFEKHGGRHLKLSIRNNVIIRAHQVPKQVVDSTEKN